MPNLSSCPALCRYNPWCWKHQQRQTYTSLTLSIQIALRVDRDGGGLRHCWESPELNVLLREGRVVLLVPVALEVDLARLGVGPAAGGPAADGGGGDGHDHLGQGQENLKVESVTYYS